MSFLKADNRDGMAERDGEMLLVRGTWTGARSRRSALIACLAFAALAVCGGRSQGAQVSSLTLPSSAPA